MWRNKTQFRAECSRIFKSRNWVQRAKRGEKIVLEPQLQRDILLGFQKFYPLNAPKRKYVEIATGLSWELDKTGRNGCFILQPSGHSVSTSCRYDLEADLKSACRGAILQQIKAVKHCASGDVDHTNPGGFKKLYTDWVKKHNINILVKMVVKSKPTLRGVPFATLREPYLSEWRNFHKKNATLELVSVEEHKRRTKRRRNSR